MFIWLSAMDIGDILYRGALISAVIILAGFFASNIFPHEKDGHSKASDLAGSLKDVLITMTSWEDDSSSEIEFGGKERSSIHFPGEIDGESYAIKVLPGSVFLIFQGNIYPAIEDVSIVPSRPPEGPGVLNRSLSRAISRVCGGFEIGTPCKLEVAIKEYSNGITLFIYPDGPVDNEDKEVMEDLDDLCDDTGQVIDGWERQVRFYAEGVEAEGTILIFKTDLTPDIDGSIGIPYLLPSTTDFSSLIDPDPYRYVLRKYSQEQRDGTYQIFMSVHTA